MTLALERTVHVVDGGLTNNFPVNYPQLDPRHTLALRLRWTNAIDLSTFDRYLSRLVYCTLEGVEEAVWQRAAASQKRNTVICDVGDIATVNFHFTASECAGLVDTGRRCARKFIEEGKIEEGKRLPLR